MTTPSSAPEQIAECIRLDDRRRPRRPSPYFTSGAPRMCARCAAPFQLQDDHIACWHGADRQYYCSETCAVAGIPGIDKTAA